MCPTSNRSIDDIINDQLNNLREELDDNVPISYTLDKKADLKKHLDKILRNNVSFRRYDILNRLDLNAFNPGKGDKVAGFVMRLYGKKIFIVALIALLLGLVPVLAAYLEGNLINPQLTIDLRKDFGYWDVIVLGLPAIIIVLGMYFSRLQRVLFSLCSSNVFSLSKSQWNKFSSEADEIYKNKFLVLTPWVVGLIVMTIWIIVFVLGKSNSWHSPNDQPWGTFAGWSHIPLVFFFFYFITLGVFRIIATFLVLNRFFKNFKTNIQPLHPDGCGGLSPLGSLSMGLNFGTFLFGIISIIGILSNIKNFNKPLFHPLNLAIIFSYLIGSSIAFFLPLYSAHREMSETKYDTVQIINHKFEIINNQLLDEFKGSEQFDQSKIDQIESLRTIHSIVSKMPVYPFNLSTISSFLGSVLIPTSIFFVEELIKYYFFK